MIQYVLWGWLTYLLAFGALIGVFIVSMWLLGLSPNDRDQAFAFSAGGGGMMLVTVILGGVALVLYVTTKTGS